MNESMTFAIVVGVFMTLTSPTLAAGEPISHTRDAQRNATVLSLALGFGISVMTSSWKPFVSAIIASGIMFASVELTARLSESGNND